MTKAKFFRDPLHLQIRLEAVDLEASCPVHSSNKSISWIAQKVIDTESFQRLRLIRQNGLANFVFHGAEHSRFSHSMGVFHLAQKIYEKICVNSSIEIDDTKKSLVAIAGLIHDIGHGPFSHTMEDILTSNGIPFDHENMTLRFIKDINSEINQILFELDASIPSEVSKFFDVTQRTEDDFIYRIVSSQLDADRLDYVQRDALFAGIRGHGFDIERLLDLMFVIGECNIAVHRGAIEALEAYLVTLDQMWRAVYYHHANRSAAVMITNLFRRAYELRKDGDNSLFPDINGNPHPMSELFDQGESTSLASYMRLTDATAWVLVDSWREHSDFVISQLANRLIKRDLLKPVTIDPTDIKAATEMIGKAKELTKDAFPDCDGVENYLFALDDPSRTSYKFYDWKPDAPNRSIWLTGQGRDDAPIENDDESGIIAALKNTRRFERLYMTSEVRSALTGS